MNEIIIAVQIETKFITEDDLVPFRSVQTRHARHHSKGRCRCLGVIGTVRINRHDTRHTSGNLRWVEKTQEPVVKVLHVYGQQPIRQLALRVCRMM
ncbi:hypothetical protein TNCV_954931 [Trichonephila clavipes]|nr:hypothetical protein TNCV_954931 [Trichonephila clavipes]